jgi:retron-type reverse transcriptase
MQALYRLALDPVAESTAGPNSCGFRKGRSTADAIVQCFNARQSILRRGSKTLAYIQNHGSRLEELIYRILNFS